MKKIKAFFSKTLYLELSFSIILGLVCGAVFYSVLMDINYTIIDSKWVNETYVPRKVEKTVQELQEFIDENNIPSNQPYEIYKWSKSHPLIYFYMERDGQILYNFYVDYSSDNAKTISEYNKELSTESDYYASYTYNYTITLADGDCTLICFQDVQYDLSNTMQNISFFLSGALIIFIITILVRKKIHYIKEVNSGINILEGGNLGYNIPVKGHDELAHVAESLNSMRIALSQQMENEKKALQANNSLVTALSHDLRTPLTTQMGYLEILKEHHYKSPEEMDKYISTALDTCHQIKEMSDRLFEYFLAFDPNPKRADDALEEFDGMEFFMQIISELTPPLMEQDFRFDVKELAESFTLKVNADDILRIFHNVFTNIDKYADENHPVIIDFRKDATHAFISFTNTIRNTPRKNESAKIGLISISSLMKRQGGSSLTRLENSHFTLELKFPLC